MTKKVNLAMTSAFIPHFDTTVTKFKQLTGGGPERQLKNKAVSLRLFSVNYFSF